MREVCEDTDDKKLSNEIGTCENHICNVENIVSSISQIHFAFHEVLKRLANLNKKPDFEPQANDDIVTAMTYIHHDLNTVMESPSAANAQLVRIFDAVKQVDYVNDHDFSNDEEETGLPTDTKTTRDNKKERNYTTASRSHY